MVYTTSSHFDCCTTKCSDESSPQSLLRKRYPNCTPVDAGKGKKSLSAGKPILCCVLSMCFSSPTAMGDVGYLEEDLCDFASVRYLTATPPLPAGHKFRSSYSGPPRGVTQQRGHSNSDPCTMIVRARAVAASRPSVHRQTTHLAVPRNGYCSQVDPPHPPQHGGHLSGDPDPSLPALQNQRPLGAAVFLPTQWGLGTLGGPLMAFLKFPAKTTTFWPL